MKKYLLFIFCCLCSTIISAQYYTNQNKIWAFGRSAGLDFTSGTPVPITTSLYGYEGCASVCNSAGQLLFYTEGATVFNRTGAMMPGGSLIVPFPTWSTTQGALIVPFVGDTNKFYIFSLRQFESGGDKLAYSIVDMTLDGGLGDLLPGSVGIILDSGMSEKMIAIPGDSCTVWLMTHKRDTTQFCAYAITSSGLSTTPVISTSGTFTASIGLSGFTGYTGGTMKCSHNRQKIATTFHASPGGIELYDFNSTTGVVSNCRVLDSSFTDPYGIEFSPDNTKLYVSSGYQWDISLPTTAAIAASKTFFGIPGSSNTVDLRLAPDGKIYVVRLGSHYLDRIDLPNAAAPGCGFVPYAVNLFPNKAMLGLPNLVWNTKRLITTGASTICTGTTTTASAPTAGGTWYSSNTSVATISPAGVITGVGPGTSIISYSTGSSCDGSTTITVIAAPTLSNSSLCVGGSIALPVITGPGTWSSSSTGIASVGAASGVITGMSPGTAIITYNGPGCPAATAIVSVNALAVTGGSVCLGSTVTFSSTVSGGTWTSGGTYTAVVTPSSGVVTGLLAGTAMITFSATGCLATTIVTVTALPVAGGSVCVGATFTATSTTSGGTWISSNPATALVGSSSGVVSGVSAGTAEITYTAGGCLGTTIVTVTALPVVGGAVCVGGTLTVSSTTPGGTWSSSTPTIAPVVSSSGIVSGITAGTAVITYSAAGCSNTTIVTVDPIAPTNDSLCIGAMLTLTAGTPGGTWVSSAPSVATVGIMTGIVSGLTSGTCAITYTNSGACTVVTIITVNATPGLIDGKFAICEGSSTLFSCMPSGGTWSSGSSSVTISSSGMVTGVSAGATVVTYMLPGGCFSTATVTVDPLPATITGPTIVALGSTITLTDATAGGSWNSSDTAKAKINSSGVVTGLALGTTTIYYSLPTGCKVSVVITVMKKGYLSVSSTGVSKPTLYPNPATNELTINVESAFTTLIIYNALGQEIIKQAIISAETKVNVKMLPPGEYQAVFKGDQVKEVLRFTKW